MVSGRTKMNGKVECGRGEFVANDPENSVRKPFLSSRGMQRANSSGYRVSSRCLIVSRPTPTGPVKKITEFVVRHQTFTSGSVPRRTQQSQRPRPMACCTDKADCFVGNQTVCRKLRHNGKKVRQSRHLFLRPDRILVLLTDIQQWMTRFGQLNGLCPITPLRLRWLRLAKTAARSADDHEERHTSESRKETE